MFYWMIPFVSGLTLGSDYINYHIYHHLDLLFSIKSGSFPLYAPACYYGQTSVYPHAQLYHPAAHLASLLPGFWQGYSLEWLTLFRLLSLGLAHFCLFVFLKKMSLSRSMAFLISLIIVYNLRMLALFWNVIALDAYTGTVFLCAAIGCCYLKPYGRRGPLLIMAAVYWLITSDFPPMVFYGLIGTIIFTMALPFLHNTIIDDVDKRGIKQIFRFWGKASFCFAGGLLLSSAYLWPFFWDYLRNSSGRVDQPYAWATQWTDTLAGTVNNFFLPLGAGFSMFGGSPLFLAALVAPVVLFLFRTRVPAVIWSLLGVIIACFLYMQGDRTPVHYWAWKYIPLVSALRGPGRISLILPPLLMMILVWLAGVSFHRAKERRTAPPMAIAAAAAFILTIVYFCMPESLFVNSHYGCPFNLRSIPGWATPVIMSSSIILLGLLFCYSIFGRGRKIIGSFLIILTIIQLMVILRYGPYATAAREKMPTYDQILAQKKEAINFQPVFFLNQHAGSSIVVRQLKNYFMEPNLATIYRRYTPAADIDEVYKRLNGDRQPDEVIIENAPPSFLPLSGQSDCSHTPDHVRLIYSSYNRLVFSARACQPSAFVFSYPYSGHWRVWLNEQEVPAFRANGAAHAIFIPAGDHAIEFRYWSNAAFYGMIASCLTLAMVIGLAGIIGRGRLSGFFVAAAGAAFAAGLFGWWYASLYSGNNLGARYEWQSPPPDTPENLAFGKPTWMSSHTPGYPYLYNSRHAVDGGRGLNSCFITDSKIDPWWQVDLGKSREIKRIVLYAGFFGTGFHTPPLMVSVSNDGKSWKQAQINPLRLMNNKTELVLEASEAVRFINIKASGECILSLNEVEVY